MTETDAYLAELAGALHVRGSAHRRFLRECRDHLADAAAERGEAGALAAFGAPAEIAAAFDAEVAARRGLRATFATAAGVLATGGSTLALIHASANGIDAPLVWVITFFVAAQVSAVSAGLALLQALVERREAIPPAQVLLLTRRNACALVAAGVTMFAAGAAVPGQGSAALLLAGPALACVALVAVLRTRALSRRLDRSASRPFRPPLEDVGRLLHLPVPALDPGRLLALTACAAAAAAFVRDRGEQATLGGALTTAAVEAVAVVACFLLLGRALGLRRA